MSKMKIRSFPVLMNYRATVEELIVGGNIAVHVSDELINKVSSEGFTPRMKKNITVRFLQEKTVSVISFGENIGTDEGVSRIKSMGMRPADIFELLTLNRTYPASPGIRKEYMLLGSIVALGSLLPKMHKGVRVKGAFLAPLLSCEDSKKRFPMERRNLRLNLTEYVDDFNGSMKKCDDWWPVITQFAAVLS
ncbi:MAG: hypothetical protein AAB630_00795 [Patescibacteria group bacterium]